MHAPDAQLPLQAVQQPGPKSDRDECASRTGGPQEGPALRGTGETKWRMKLFNSCTVPNPLRADTL